MELSHYFDRIKYGGLVAPDYATLEALHAAHVCSVPFENLDVQLGRPLTIRIEDAYNKIVVNGRGGWCYEQNGLFGWVLSEIGFDVTRIAGNVMREKNGEAAAASHLCLLVTWPDTESRYLVDVGFGGSMIKPIELREAQHHQPPFQFGLDRLDDAYWRFWEDPGDGKFSFDFMDDPACETSLAQQSERLQNDPDSSFVLTLVAQQRHRDRHCTLRGRVFSVSGPDGIESTLLESSDALVSILAKEFRLEVCGIAELWPAIVARHEQVFGTDATWPGAESTANGRIGASFD
ncbi:MAG: arylamine N-acetyltransferase [Gammaproteobacteria bacterium]|nr:arylamine N-acetyltransferase [Gammaproteobacteria bacterium]